MLITVVGAASGGAGFRRELVPISRRN